MADTLPIDTTSPVRAELTHPPVRRYTPSAQELARLAAATERLTQRAARRGLSPEEYAEAGVHATDEHWLRDLDVDSVCPFEGATTYQCLRLGGQS
ncbi:hypothetical protein AB0F20_05485 [Streptomyces goshikiensis]|uniref:hypothetical protein n=1 Tax=Streptomyces goshikiensis TaxID=1942 RepID=UPI0033E384A7